MNGDWTIKSIVKAIPNCKINYEDEDNISGGTDAQLHGLKIQILMRQKKKRKPKLLLEYCSKDTLAIFHLIKIPF